MLLHYTVCNFQSINQPIEFTMISPGACCNGDRKALQRCGIFGPNASGKTSLLQSIAFLREYLLNGGLDQSNITPHLFRNGSDDTTSFQIVLHIDGVTYDYKLSLNPRCISEETLSIPIGSARMRELFHRTLDDDGQTVITITDAFASPESAERNLAEVLKLKVAANQSFLYQLHDNGIRLAEQLIGWFRDIVIVSPDTTVLPLPPFTDGEDKYLQFLSGKLRDFDVGIERIDCCNPKMSLSDFMHRYAASPELAKEIEALRYGIIVHDGRLFLVSEDSTGWPELSQITFTHRLNNTDVSFDFGEESGGTQYIVLLLTSLFTTGRKPTVCLINDLDCNLHCRVARHLIDLFADELKGQNSQVIFTAHDSQHLVQEGLSQEEVWFMGNDSAGASKLLRSAAE